MIFLTLLCATSQAYELYSVNGNDVKWSVNHATMNIDVNATADQEGWIQEARSAFYKQGSSFWFAVVNDTDSWAYDNGESEITFDPDSSLNAPAHAVFFHDSSGVIDECDILMGDWLPWVGGDRLGNREYVTGGGPEVVSVLVHELGHCAGLGHEADVYNVMGSAWRHIHTNGDVVSAYVGEDATAGLRYLYGDWSGARDLGVSHWKYAGATGAYSDHTRTQLRDVLGTPLTSWTLDIEPGYTLQKDVGVFPEVTLENNGTSAQSVTLAYMLSSDNEITSSDLELERVTVYLTPDTTTTYAGTAVTIPGSQATGFYHLGVLIDPDSAVSEFNEANNATYLAHVLAY